MNTTAYILAPHVALRSWERVPHAYVERFRARPQLLSADEFHVALACDGTVALEPSAELERLVRHGLVRPCAPREAELAPWQRYRACPNRVMPWLTLEITARCNYNCIHCFNATDNSRLHAQMALEQVRQVLDGAQAAGVNAVLLTGGEPLMHPQFLEIMAAVYERGMFVFEINTNGRFLTKELLERIAAFGFKPEMKISFDGLGFHDWMRGCEGAEQDALRAIRLCVEAGFPTRVQMNINHKNHDSILPSLELFDAMGVGRARVIPTTSSVRWEMNAQGQSMDWGEYLQAFLDIAAVYAQGEHEMELDGWHAATLYPAKRAYRLIPVRYAKPGKGAGRLPGSSFAMGQRRLPGAPALFKESRPCCATICGMAAVAADGELYPCLQCSGWFSAHGVSFGNVLADGFVRAISNEAYCRAAYATVADKLDHLRAPGFAGDGHSGRSCGECPWLAWCAGGCPALAALAHDGDMLAPDPASCEFFRNDWPERFARALTSWRCLNPLAEI